MGLGSPASRGIASVMAEGCVGRGGEVRDTQPLRARATLKEKRCSWPAGEAHSPGHQKGVPWRSED